MSKPGMHVAFCEFIDVGLSCLAANTVKFGCCNNLSVHTIFVIILHYYQFELLIKKTIIIIIIIIKLLLLSLLLSRCCVEM